MDKGGKKESTKFASGRELSSKKVKQTDNYHFFSPQKLLFRRRHSWANLRCQILCLITAKREKSLNNIQCNRMR